MGIYISLSLHFLLPAPSMSHTSIRAGSGMSSDQGFWLLHLTYTLLTRHRPPLPHCLELALWNEFVPNSLATGAVLIPNDSAIKGREGISAKGRAQVDSEKSSLIWISIPLMPLWALCIGGGKSGRLFKSQATWLHVLFLAGSCSKISKHYCSAQTVDTKRPSWQDHFSPWIPDLKYSASPRLPDSLPLAEC